MCVDIKTAAVMAGTAAAIYFTGGAAAPALGATTLSSGAAGLTTATAVTGGTAAASSATLANAALVASTAGAATAAYGQYQQGQYQSDVAKENAKTQSATAKDALDRGDIQEMGFRRQLAQVKGDQRAAMGANNVDMTSGSLSGIQQDTAQFGELDALTIRSNAQREAYGHNVESTNYNSSAKMSRMAGNYGAASSLLTTAGSVGRDWYMYKGGMPAQSIYGYKR